MPGSGEGESPMAEFLFELKHSTANGAGADDVTISFAEDDLVQDPASRIRSLVDFGLVYEENGTYLALPVYKGRSATDARWRNFDL